jgi:DNA-binding transcriptional LysR family regulator
MQPEPNDLLLFACVVEEGSFSRAAQRLDVPVSTVSRRITKLETRLGERLLLRNTRKVKVSELGHAVLEHARHVVEGVEAAAAVADNRRHQPSGRLRVSMLSDLGLLGPFLAEFVSTYPLIILELEVSTRLVDLVPENFDVALHIGQLCGDSMLAARRIVDLHGGLYASPGYLKRRGTPSEPNDLIQHDALHGVLRRNEPIQWVLHRGKLRWQGLPSGRIVADMPELLVGMAIHGSGIVMAQHCIVEPYVESGRLVRVLPEWESPAVPLSAVFPNRRLMPARTRVFIDALTGKLGSLEDGQLELGRSRGYPDPCILACMGS